MNPRHCPFDQMIVINHYRAMPTTISDLHHAGATSLSMFLEFTRLDSIDHAQLCRLLAPEKAIKLNNDSLVCDSGLAVLLLLF